MTPSIEDAEALQGFDRGWTAAAQDDGRKSARWKLVGNAVTTGVAAWLGRRLAEPGSYDAAEVEPLRAGDRWPGAAWGANGQQWRSQVSMWPEQQPYTHLLELLDRQRLTPLSYRAAAGFLERTQRAKLRFDPDFIVAVKNHVRATEPGQQDVLRYSAQ